MIQKIQIAVNTGKFSPFLLKVDLFKIIGYFGRVCVGLFFLFQLDSVFLDVINMIQKSQLIDQGYVTIRILKMMDLRTFTYLVYFLNDVWICESNIELIVEFVTYWFVLEH